ncbi:MAG: hypothetical protein R3223_01730 [Longimicrobiales bacterium]|nr:hypothetical protein [Longimicrobiales bacterium]
MTEGSLESVCSVRLLAVAVAVLLSTLTPGCASPGPVEIGEVEPSTPVRVETSDVDGGAPGRAAVVGRFESYDSERIYLSVPGGTGPDTIGWEDVDHVRVSTGRRIGAGFVLGMWGGLAVGWGALYLIEPDSYGWLYLPLVTVPVGGIVGGIFAPEAWAPVEVPR